MEAKILIILFCGVLAVSAWSRPFYPVYAAQRIPHGFIRHVRHAHPAPKPIIVAPVRDTEEQWQRPKRDHDFDSDFDYGHDHENDRGRDHDRSRDRDRSRGVTGPVHTFVKTDKNANYKWGVRHHVGNKFAS